MGQGGNIRRGLPAATGLPTPSDRRFRRSDVRLGGRRSWRAGLGRLLLVAAACLATLALLAWTAGAVANASVFAIDRIVVHGNVRLTSDEVRQLLDGIGGQSIFHADLEDYRLRLMDSPWVAEAAVWRVFPSTVEVRVAERTPLAIARLNRQLFLVDATGVIIDAAGPQYREFDLPIVDGLLPEAGGTVRDVRKLQVIERLLSDLAGREDLLRRISQVDVSNPRNVVVLLDGEPARLFLGDTAFLERLQQYEEAAPKVREYLSEADYWELRSGRPAVGLVRATKSRVDVKTGK